MSKLEFYDTMEVYFSNKEVYEKKKRITGRELCEQNGADISDIKDVVDFFGWIKVTYRLYRRNN